MERVEKMCVRLPKKVGKFVSFPNLHAEKISQYFLTV